MLRTPAFFVLLSVLLSASPVLGQPGRERTGDGEFRPPQGPGGPGGRGGFGGFQSRELDLVETYDANGDGWLNRAERAEARAALTERRGEEGGFGRRPGGRGRGGAGRGTPEPGARVSPEHVASHPDAPLYDIDVLRTIFLRFENEDWESELEDFHGTDVEVPATMIVDGQSYEGVGVHFRGASSYMMVPTGFKRSLNVSVDFIDDEQRLYGYKTLNLLNCSGDASMMSTVLYSQMAGARLAAPKANFVKVVVNGEYWGVYVSVQQFDKVFTAENFGSSKGTRWKVPGSPRGDGGLAYDGDDLEAYKARYDMKSNDGDEAWDALVELCRVLDETPTERLVEELGPILDIDETLWFLAFDVALVNSDGYWTRASDYSIFRDRDGRFHMIPHDMNEAFRGARGGGGGGFRAPADGRRGGGGPGGPGGGVSLDPLSGLANERMPLRSRLLAVPELRERYLGYVREIAEHSLDWDRLGPQVARYRELIDEAVRADTRKLDTYEAFVRATSTGSDAEASGSLQSFASGRRAYLLEYEPTDHD